MPIEALEKISNSTQLRDRRASWFFGAIAGLSVLICARHGLGMDVDSTAYLSSATNLAHGHGLTGIGGVPYTLFGPALPGFVSLGVLVGMSAQAAALILNVACAVATVLLGRTLVMRHVSDLRLVSAASVFLAIGWPLLQVTSLAIPEPLTVVTVLLLILFLEDFEQTSRPARSLAVIVLLLNLAFFLRYAGLVFIPIAALVIFVSRRPLDGAMRRVISASVVTVLGVLGPCLWMLRNHSVDGSLLGPRYQAIFSATTVAHQYVLAIAKLFLPGPDIVEDIVFVAVIILTGWALRVVYLATPGGATTFVRLLGPWAVLLLICVSYVLYLYAAELSTKIDPIDSRLLVPIYIPSLILLLGLIESVLSQHALSEASRQLMRRVLLLFLCVQVIISLALIGDFALRGRDFTSTAWRTSALVTSANSLTGAVVIYTNNPQGLWARLGSDNIHVLPNSSAKVRARLSCDDVRIVFFSEVGGTYYGDSSSVTADGSPIPLATLRSDLKLKTLFSNDQGEVLSVTSEDGSSRCSS